MIEQLIKIQTELKAPKQQYNSFGKYNYRNVEDIQEAVKPLLHKYGLFLTLSDEIKSVNDVLFVEASAIITDGEKSITVKAQAGIDVNKKGMDRAQQFGSASSYARKYALGAMFLLDDTKDADATNTHGKTNTTLEKPVLVKDSDTFLKAIDALKKGTATIDAILGKYAVKPDVLELLKSA